MSDPNPVSWQEQPDEFRGDIGATVALDAKRWTAAGAAFSAIDDGDGETVGLARAKIATRSGDIDFGILDYGEQSTFILVAADAQRMAQQVRVVLETLTNVGVLAPDEVLDESSPSEESIDIANAPEIVDADVSAPSVHPPTERKARKPRGRGRKQIRNYKIKRAKSLHGKIVSFDEATGFAVVRPADGSPEVAVHRSKIRATSKKKLKAGVRVNYKRGATAAADRSPRKSRI